jgi:3-hydroxyisobutyrate dehydrogenase-like beta-hydroxyacid dehydrogenase
MEKRDRALGIVGFGEVGFGFAKGLKREGLHNILAYDKFWNQDPYSDLIQRRAEEAGVKLVPSIEEVVNGVESIFVAVATSVARDVALDARPYLRAGQLYIDVSSSSPRLKKELYEIIRLTGARFVDAAIVGPLPLYGHRVPTLACGPGAGEYKNLFGPFGMDITVIGDEPGQASAIKMFRSIFMKGIEALFLEMLVAAARYNVDKEVLESIAETLEKTPFVVSANRYVTGDAIHAARRVHEMEGVIETLVEMGLDPVMSLATKKKLEWSASLGLKEYFGGQTPASYKDVMKAIEERLSLKGDVGNE